jgi:hypothetical protein
MGKADGDGKRATRAVGASTPISYTYDVNTSLPLVLNDGTRKYVYGLGLAYTVDITGTLQVPHPPPAATCGAREKGRNIRKRSIQPGVVTFGSGLSLLSERTNHKLRMRDFSVDNPRSALSLLTPPSSRKSVREWLRIAS